MVICWLQAQALQPPTPSCLTGGRVFKSRLFFKTCSLISILKHFKPHIAQDDGCFPEIITEDYEVFKATYFNGTSS